MGGTFHRLPRRFFIILEIVTEHLTMCLTLCYVSGDAEMNGPWDIWNGRSCLLRAKLLAFS